MSKMSDLDVEAKNQEDPLLQLRMTAAEELAPSIVRLLNGFMVEYRGMMEAAGATGVEPVIWMQTLTGAIARNQLDQVEEGGQKEAFGHELFLLLATGLSRQLGVDFRAAGQPEVISKPH